jgi:hypothetical protein
MVANGTWTLRTITTDVLIEIFVSRSVWHGTYTKLFPNIQEFPLLRRWLEGGEDAPSDIDVFGVARTQYTFKDLSAAIDMMKEAREKQGKRKRMAGDGGKSKRYQM